MIGIYAIKIEKFIYIGSSFNIERRVLQHKNSLNKNKHTNRFLQQLVNNLGLYKINIEILESCSKLTKFELLIKEQYFIDEFKNKNDFLVLNILNTNYNTNKITKKYSREEIHNFRISSMVDPFTGNIVNSDYDGNLIDAHSGQLIQRSYS